MGDVNRRKERNTYTAEKVMIRVFFRPTLSANEPNAREPIMTPNIKTVIDKGVK